MHEAIGEMAVSVIERQAWASKTGWSEIWSALTVSMPAVPQSQHSAEKRPGLFVNNPGSMLNQCSHSYFNNLPTNLDFDLMLSPSGP